MSDETLRTLDPDDVEQVEWDLAPLVDGDADAGALRLLDDVVPRLLAGEWEDQLR